MSQLVFSMPWPTIKTQFIASSSQRWAMSIFGKVLPAKFKLGVLCNVSGVVLVSDWLTAWRDDAT
jgi:hypothetical protein